MKRSHSSDASSDSSDEETYGQMCENEKDKEKLLSCQVCFKKYKNRQTLKRHMQTHISNRKCELCEKAFTRLESLRKHQKNIHGIHHEKKQSTTSFLCELCNKCFKTKYNLVRHKSKVHQSATPKQQQNQFSCRHCEMEFQSYDKLFRHVTQRHPLNQQGGRSAERSRTLDVNEPMQDHTELQVNVANDKTEADDVAVHKTTS
jgi:uncharacterized Zn-finger protein